MGGTLINLGAFPGLIDHADHNGMVVCEVYEVDDTVLKYLDRIEGHPHFYKRGTSYAYKSEAEDPELVETYWYQTDGDKSFDIIKSGDWMKR